MYEKIYFVTFDIRRNRKEYHYVYHVRAHDAKEAKELAKKEWTLDGHQFHLYAKRSAAPDAKFLKVTSWKGNTYIGEKCLNAFICTDF